jgi:ribosome maturation factor RimP
MKLDDAVQRELSAMVADEGLDLLSTEVVGAGSKMIVRLIVDSPDGVNLDQCAAVSRQASALLDVEDPIGHRYTLEVTSPGLDRKLYNAADYDRYAGQRVTIRMAPSFREHRTVVGRLDGLRDDHVHVVDDSGNEVMLPYSEVFEARLEVDWDAIMKEGKSRS